MSQLERELIERARERGVDRATARQTLMDKLLWREKGEVVPLLAGDSLFCPRTVWAAFCASFRAVTDLREVIASAQAVRTASHHYTLDWTFIPFLSAPFWTRL